MKSLHCWIRGTKPLPAGTKDQISQDEALFTTQQKKCLLALRLHKTFARIGALSYNHDFSTLIFPECLSVHHAVNITVSNQLPLIIGVWSHHQRDTRTLH